jgi:hypothetical protein
MKRKPLFTLRKRSFLNPTSTGHTSYILAEVESSDEGAYKWGHYMLTFADCRRRIQLEFFLGTKQARRISLAKINLLIDVLTKFRDALAKEIALIEKGESRRPKSAPKASSTKTKMTAEPASGE